MFFGFQVIGGIDWYLVVDGEVIVFGGGVVFVLGYQLQVFYLDNFVYSGGVVYFNYVDILW